MRRMTLVATVMSMVGVAAAAPALRAQAGAAVRGPIAFGVAAGLAQPRGYLADGASGGFSGATLGTSLAAFVALKPLNWPVGLRSEVAYSHFGSENLAFPGYMLLPGSTFRPYNADTNVLDVTESVVLPLAVPLPRLHLYAIGGLGLDQLRESPAYGRGRTAYSAGWNAGGGVTVPLGRLSAFAEARYHRATERGAAITFVPVTVGVTS